MEVKKKSDGDKQVQDVGGTVNVSGISGNNNLVVVGSAVEDMANGSQSNGSSDMEEAIISTFRSFTMREKVGYMNRTYDYQDKVAADRKEAADLAEKEKQK